MKFLANENFPLASVQLLKATGYDITAIGVDYPGVTDEEVIKIASIENRSILTFDRDYGELIFRHDLKPPAGVIYLRIRKYKPDEPAQLIHSLVLRPDIVLEQALTVLDYKLLRQRRY